MNSISLHISYLLRHHDCVIVPGFGAFISVAVPSSWNEDTLTLTPPYTRICFNPNLTTGDGLLVNSVARKNRISYQMASTDVEDDVNAWKSALRKHGTLAVRNIGSFQLGEENNLVFTPSPSHLNPSFLSARSSISADTIISGIPEAAALEGSSPVFPGYRPDKNYYIPVNKTFAKVAASFLLLFSCFFALLVPSFGRQDALPYPMEQKAAVVPLPAASSSEKVSSQSGIEKEALADTIAQIKEISDNSVTPSHYLVVATFKTRREAERFIAHRPQAADSLTIVETGKMVRVSAASAMSKEELLPVMRQKKFREDFPDSWIFSY